MKKRFLFLLVSSMIAIFIGTGCQRQTEELLSKNEIQDFLKWKLLTPDGVDIEVPGHGKKIRYIYANQVSFQKTGGTKGDSYEAPQGAILVKAVYSDRNASGKEKPSLTIMKKNSNHVLSQKGWLYFTMMPGEKPLLVQGRKCIGCHEAANEKHPYFDRNVNDSFRDYLFVPMHQYVQR